ncbi:MAG: 2-hydroxychromene-2-carboxylate isomerase [Rhodobacteraceae bacterium]|nr:2-hydroxychromene-2-carboxylate isomerase [Paracoccaceae bacterium]
MAHIDYYFTVLSPFTYLAGHRLEDSAARHGASVTYKPLDIMALFARTGGLPPKERHPARQAYRLQDLARTARKRGVPLNPQPAFWPTNPVPASCAIIAAQKAGGDLGALVHAVTRRVWAEEQNIAEDKVVRDALEEAGFAPALAESGMVTGAGEYAANLEDAVAGNVFGAPFYVVDGTEHFWGQDRLEDLDLYLSGAM